MSDLACFLPFVMLAVALWTLAWILTGKASRRADQQLSGRAAKGFPWAAVFAVLLALLAFGVTLCTGSVMFHQGDYR